MSGKFALVIGNTEYTDPGLVQLTAPGNDAQDFARVLRDPALCAFDDVKVVFNEFSSTVTEAIDEFFDQRKPDDLLVLYFSGHGVRDELGSLYLAVRNTIRTRLRATGIKSDYIREAMDQSRSKRQLVVLDCCNSGAFPQGTKAERGGPMGLGSALQGYGRYVLMASDTTQFAWEGDQVIGEAKDSLFTHFLVKGLEGEADRDADGRINVDELYDYAYEEIAKVTTAQTPTKAASKVEGEFVLRRITRLEDIKPVPLPDDLLDEVKDPRPYVREAAVEKLESILKGRNLGLRRSAIDALERIAADDNTTPRVARAARQVLETYRQGQLEAEAPVATETRPPVEAQPITAGPTVSAIKPAVMPAAAKASPVVVGTDLVPDVQPRPARPGGINRFVWIGASVGLLAIGSFALWGMLSHSPSIPTPGPTDTPPAGTATSAAAETAAVLPADLGSPSAVPASTGVLPVTGGPRIGSPAESMSAWTNGVPTLRDKAQEQYTASDNSSPTTLYYHDSLAQSDRVLWEWYWCSQSLGILYKNLGSINLKFELDGRDVTSQLQNGNFTNGTLQCRIYFIALSNWPAGTYHLVTTLTITDLINDGSSDYVPGDYIDDYTVTVP